jgi:hypothetical protein
LKKLSKGTPYKGFWTEIIQKAILWPSEPSK